MNVGGRKGIIPGTRSSQIIVIYSDIFLRCFPSNEQSFVEQVFHVPDGSCKGSRGFSSVLFLVAVRLVTYVSILSGCA